MTRPAISAVFPPGTLPQGTLAQRALTPELEVLRRQNPLTPAARGAPKQASGEHPIAEDGCGLPHSGLDAGIAPGILGAEAGLAAAERTETPGSGRARRCRCRM
jgi:hypothetical protein